MRGRAASLTILDVTHLATTKVVVFFVAQTGYRILFQFRVERTIAYLFLAFIRTTK
jgi:hypothetical protein